MFKAQISSIQGLGIPFNTKEEGFNRVLFSFAQGIQVSVVWTPKLSTAKYAQSDVHAKHLNMISIYIYICLKKINQLSSSLVPTSTKQTN
jgi:hypothetical protein